MRRQRRRLRRRRRERRRRTVIRRLRSGRRLWRDVLQLRGRFTTRIEIHTVVRDRPRSGLALWRRRLQEVTERSIREVNKGLVRTSNRESNTSVRLRSRRQFRHTLTRSRHQLSLDRRLPSRLPVPLTAPAPSHHYQPLLNRPPAAETSHSPPPSPPSSWSPSDDSRSSSSLCARLQVHGAPPATSRHRDRPRRPQQRLQRKPERRENAPGEATALPLSSPVPRRRKSAPRLCHADSRNRTLEHVLSRVLKLSSRPGRSHRCSGLSRRPAVNLPPLLPLRPRTTWAREGRGSGGAAAPCRCGRA